MSALRARSKLSGGGQLSLGSRICMWGGLAVGMVFYVLFGIAPAAANVLVSFTNYSGLPGSPTSFAGLSNYTALWTTRRAGLCFQHYRDDHLRCRRDRGPKRRSDAAGPPVPGDSQDGHGPSCPGLLPDRPGRDRSRDCLASAFRPVVKPGTGCLRGYSASIRRSSGPTPSAMPLVIIVQVWQNLGFTMVVFIGSLLTIPHSIYEAAHARRRHAMATLHHHNLAA